MRKRKTRLAAAALALVMLLSLVPQAFALSPGEAAARELHALGLFQGTGTLADGSPNFELDRGATRGEAITMLVRLLGLQPETLPRYPHPFTDAGWADLYIGYAYHTGLSAGLSSTTFGTSTAVNEVQFLTMVMRALGYTVANWRDPYPEVDRVGLTHPSNRSFTRGDMAVICASALDCTVNGTGDTLLDRLRAQGAVDSGDGFLPGPVSAPIGRIEAASEQELVRKLVQAMEGHMGEIDILVPTGQTEYYIDVMSREQDALYETRSWSVSWNPVGREISLSLGYNDGVRVMAGLEGRSSSLSREDAQLLEQAQRIHASLVDPSMSEYEQVKAFHDYLVRHVTYDGNAPHCFDAYGALVDGRAVCDGYSIAFDLLCYLSGIDCIRVLGTSSNALGTGGHAWNKVKVNGSWYNVDVTWDDPLGNYSNNIFYDYFLVSDNVLARDHYWKNYEHIPAAPANYSR